MAKQVHFDPNDTSYFEDPFFVDPFLVVDPFFVDPFLAVDSFFVDSRFVDPF